MKTMKTWLTTVALLLCSFTASAITYPDWVSDNAGNSSSTSTKSYTINANKGDVLTFDWLVSSESNYDWLIVTLNGTQILKKSGVYSGTYSHTFSSSGSNVLVVTYSKDHSVNSNADWAQVYNIMLSSDTPSSDTPTLIASGACSSNLTWKITEDLELIIEGSGDMVNYERSSEYPWYEYRASITGITIGEGVTSIGKKAFDAYGCDSRVTNLSIASTVKTIGEYAFDTCDKLTTLTIPEGCTTIESWAFLYCSGLTSVTLPNTLTYIGDRAFASCWNLEAITIPKNVAFIGKIVFRGCTKLTSIAVDINNKVYDSRNNCNAIIETQTNKLLQGCLTTIIPENIEIIGEGAFYEHDGLIITIPRSVNKIEDWAFYGTQGSGSKITFLSKTPPETEGDPFELSYASLWVPYGCEEEYNIVPYNSRPIYELPSTCFNLVDGEVYSRQEVCNNAEEVVYTRTLPNLHWNALYVPFKIPYETIAEGYEVAYVNAVHSYDNDENGTIDELSMEVVKIKSGTLKANYPYLIKARNQEAKAMTLSYENVTLYAAEENAVNCSSVYQIFEIKGSYSRKSAEDLSGSLAISTTGAWQPLATGTYLSPFRLYLTITNRDDSPVEVEPAALSRVRIIENGETTGIINLTPTASQNMVIYDLSGRRVKVPQKGQIYIVNGKKAIY